MFIFGEFNVFRPADARLVLQKAAAALADGGLLLLEPHTYDAVKNMGAEAPSWFSSTGGLFSDHPHIALMDSHWSEEAQAATQRYFIIDAASGAVQRFASSYQAYTNDQYTHLLDQCGFTAVRFYPALGQTDGEPDSSLIAVTAGKPAG